MMKYPFLLVVLSFFFASCGNNDAIEKVQHIEVQSEFKAKVKAVAGDVINDEAFNTVPIFFNVGGLSLSENQEFETIILSDRLSKGKILNIKPISLLTFKKDTSQQNYIISVPVDSLQNVYEIYSYHDLSQKQFQTKFLIEDWFRANCKLGLCSKFEWKSEVQALKLVQ